MKAGPSHRREGNLKRQGGTADRVQTHSVGVQGKSIPNRLLSAHLTKTGYVCMGGYGPQGEGRQTMSTGDPVSPVTVLVLASLALFTLSRGAGTLQSYEVPVYTASEEHNTPFVYILSKDAFNFKGKV